MRARITGVFLLLLACSLVSASDYPPSRQCEAGLCQCGSYCRALEGEQSCCPSKDGYPEHICGPSRKCCGIGCCREGWVCGPYDLCYQPGAWTSSLRPDHTSTIITVVRPNPEHPTTDAEISGSLPTISSVGTKTLPGSPLPTSQDASHSVPIVVTQPDGQVTTLLSVIEESATTDLPIMTGSDGLESTYRSQASTPSDPAISTVITKPDGEASTVIPPTEIGSETSEATPKPDDKTTVELPISGTGSKHFTSATSTNIDDQEPTQLPTGTVETGSDIPITVSDTISDHVSRGQPFSTLSAGFGTTNPEESEETIPATEPVVTRSDTSSPTFPPGGTNPSITASEAVSDQTSEDQPSSTFSIGFGTTDAEISQGTVSATETIVSEPSGVTTMDTEIPNESAALTTDTLATIPFTSDTDSAASTAISDGLDVPTTLPSTEQSPASPDETNGTATHSAGTNTDPTPLPTVPETLVNGVTSDVSAKPTTLVEEHSTGVDDGAPTEPGHIATSNGNTDQTSSGIYIAVPVTTSVTKPEARDDGFVVPCNMWFFNACIGPISGWGVSLPPGIYPPGPPPAISDNPKGGIEINTNRPLPDWPSFTVGPGNTPTFSNEPTACETESAELCATSTSYSVNVDVTVTSTVTSDVISTCGTVYGCKVQGRSQTITATDISTASSEMPVAPTIRAMESWPQTEESEAKLKSIAKRVQSELDSLFGTATKTATTTTVDASQPTESVWTGACPAKNGPDPTVVDGKFPENIGEKCLCEWNTWMRTDKSLQPYTVDQLRDAINDFCDGSRKLRKPAPTGPPDIAVHRFPTDGTHGIFIQAGWATPPLWNSTDERCKAKGDLLLADSCKTALLRFECRGAMKEDLWGGVYYEALDEGGCVRWTLTPAHLPNGSAAERSMEM
ncbi:hypothetical protein F53441_8178 [Fusarium austroafricanum]|uniref:Chitin-binding type-1 domain-containing protein n=1 Tax=Fusarium austroafricanum TaxID=2364996 RepID=A0A8H4KDT6_9HYPO|nr:hypothetical protein F53441_8178 [Fusarium austroafricanum]